MLFQITLSVPVQPHGHWLFYITQYAGKSIPVTAGAC